MKNEGATHMDTPKQFFKAGGELVDYPGWYKIDGGTEDDSNSEAAAITRQRNSKRSGLRSPWHDSAGGSNEAHERSSPAVEEGT